MPMCLFMPVPQDCATILGVVDLRLGYPPHKWRNVYKASAAAWIRLGGAERGWGHSNVKLSSPMRSIILAWSTHSF